MNERILALGLEQLLGYYQRNEGVFEGIKVTNIETQQDGSWQRPDLYVKDDTTLCTIQFVAMVVQHPKSRVTHSPGMEYAGRLNFSLYHSYTQGTHLARLLHDEANLPYGGDVLLKVIRDLGQLAYEAEASPTNVQQAERKAQEDQERAQSEARRQYDKDAAIAYLRDRFEKGEVSWVLGESRLGIDDGQ